MKVLIAGSEPVSRAVLEAALVRAGHEVVSCRSGRAALQILAEPGAPPVAFLDSGLPGKDALAVCAEVRAAAAEVRACPYLIVVTSGGPGREREAALAREAGADDAMHRPLTADLVVARMATAARVIESRQAMAATRGPGDVAAPIADKLVGRTIDGKYEILDVLGRGGMGTVYRARHVLVDEVVAFKVIHPNLAGSPGFAERFVREAKTLLRITHENVVSVRDVGATREGALYMTLDYSPGRSLGDLLREAGAMPEERAVRIAAQIAAGLAAAHAAGVVHRDLKPDNVLVEADDRLRVCDFGLAKLVGGDAAAANISGVGVVIGTPFYMAPEQAAAAEVDGRTDLYALGCILYELVCGARVFEGTSATRLMRSHLFEAPVPPSRRGGLQVSGPLEALILRLLAKDPDRRPSTAAGVRDALEALLARRGPTSRLRVLVADDSGVSRALLAGMLTRWGHQVVVARDGLEALDLATHKGPFDVLLLDGEMPGLDGPEVATRIRAHEWTAGGERAPIVALTSNAGSADRARCQAAGMDDALGKPIRPDELAAVLSRLTRSAPKTAEQDAEVFDRRTAMTRVEGDADLLRETVGLFLEEEGRMIGDIREALARGDAERVGRAAHALKGAAANCAVSSVARAAGRLEALVRSGRLAAVEPEVATLGRELERARPVLAELVARQPA